MAHSQESGFSRRDLLTAAAGLAAGVSAQGGGDVSSAEVAPPPTTNPEMLHFSNLNQPQRYQYTRSSDLSGRRRFAFLDTRQVRDISGAELRFHPAEKHGDPVLECDPTLETGVLVYGSVLHDGQRFRMWYQPIAHKTGPGNPYDVSYAESTDGVHWERPKLGVVSRGGSKKNNLVNMRGHGPSVMDLGAAAPPERRYLGIAVGFAPILGVPEALDHPKTRRHHGYWMYYSADGFRWQLYERPDCGILNYMSDTACFVHDPHRGRVLGSVKLEPRVRLFDRRSVTIASAATSDLAQWSSPRLALYPDELDDRMAVERGARFLEFYGMGILPTRDVLIGFPEAYWVKGGLHPSQVAGVRLGWEGKCDIQMAYSYDGHAWHRSLGRQPLIALGKPGSWDAGFLTMQGSAVEVDGMTHLYYSANPGGHAFPSQLNTRKIGLARVRQDRFASIGTNDRGMVEVFHGRRAGNGLAVNSLSRDGGEVRVEVRRPRGKRSEPIAGFSGADCRPVRGDDIRHTVAWKDRTWQDLPAGEDLLLRFQLVNSDVFAYELLS